MLFSFRCNLDRLSLVFYFIFVLPFSHSRVGETVGVVAYFNFIANDATLAMKFIYMYEDYYNRTDYNVTQKFLFP